METTPSGPPNKTHFAGKFRPPLLDLTAAPIRIGGEGTLQVTDDGIIVSGHQVTGGLINTLMLLPVGFGLCWYVATKLSGWGLSTFDIVTSFSGIFVGLFVIAAIFLKPIVMRWKPATESFAWRDIQTVYPHPKPDKPLVICVLHDYKRRRIHFTSRGPGYEVEAALTQHPKFQPTHML